MKPRRVVKLRSLNHLAIEPFISGPRLSKYQTFFKPNNDVELFGCYLWNKDVVSAFFPIIQLMEVSLRNSIHNNAKSKFGDYWFDHIATRTSSGLTQEQQGNVNYHHNALKTARSQIKREQNFGKNTQVSADRIIAKMTFGFWTNLFRVPFEINRNPLALWPTLIRPVFPNLPRRHRSRTNIHGHVQAIQTFRNKAFHHEPVWNIGRPATIKDAINQLHEQKNTLLNVLKWVSKDFLEVAYKAGYVSQIDLVLSKAYLDHLRSPNSNELPLSKFKRELNSIFKKDIVIVDILKNSHLIAKSYSSK